MTAFRSLSLSLALAAAAAAQTDHPESPIARLSQRAEADLARSVDELGRLREQIAAEKLPLAQALTAQEEKLTRLRAEHERISRVVDEGNLELGTVKTEMKARQDELTYDGNLLDEYVRNFEAKVLQCELQYCGTAIAAASKVQENAGLSPDQRFARQLDLVKVSVQRLRDAIGGMRFRGIAVDLQGAVLEGQYALLGPVALFAAGPAAAGLVVPQTGSARPLVRPLEGEDQQGIVAVVQQGEGRLPLDPSRGGALKALVQRTNLIHIFEKGGPIMWPLLLASVLALGTVLERLLFLANERRKRDPEAMEELFEQVEKGNLGAAVQAARSSSYFVARALGYALEHKEKSFGNALVFAQGRELKRFRRGIPILDTVITLAPLLGLLGTVTGMMGSFSLIGGELSSPGAITGGIAEALIATAFGLGIAIVSLLPFNFLNSKLDEATAEIESAGKQLELLIHPQAGPAVLVPHQAGTGQPAAAGEVTLATAEGR